MKMTQRFPSRRHALALTLAAALGAAPFGSALAADAYPSKPIKVIVPFAPGGPTDIMGRYVAKVIGDALKQTVIVENRAGAGGNLGTDAVAKSAPDGYTLGIGAISSLAIAPGLYEKLPYNAAKDFAPITLVGIAKGAILAHPSAPFNDLKGMLAYAKANPGKLNYASSGIGTANHLAGEYLQSLAGVDLQHVPYKGTAAAVQDLLAGNVLLSVESSLTSAAQHVTSGKLKAIAITSATRSKMLPNVPTVAEQGFPGFDVPTWFGLIAPAGTPKEVVATLNRVITDALKSPDAAERFAQIGAEPHPTTPDQFGAYIREETARWTKVIKSANIKPE
ncbi:Bug family tripartite tricarboxylate transporter substrate binding protein [Sphaerotilus microaerophilus]|uniref:MFS transporter n=1 Tax=Sphaerotilus microaerophilus TaxID=2914710 RepID=A0ABN6PEL1_9BURK|nr:tripartite tricarboxylate transporter substrate binding protein [Sphaerotilus sp. FB-5]BDI03434.1 MFS transporter [Sphaerotilus sp. FB-5]